MKYDITNFRVVEVVKGYPTISVTKNGITFSQAAIQKLNKSEYVEILIDEMNKILAVVAKKEKTENSFHFMAPEKTVLSVRIGNPDLRSQLTSLMGWQLNDGKGYKLIGEYEKEYNALFFDLKAASDL